MLRPPHAVKRAKKEPQLSLLNKSNETKASWASQARGRLSRFFTAKTVRRLRWLFAGSVIMVTIYLTASAAYLMHQRLYQDKFFNGLKIANASLGGKTLTEARRLLTQRTDAFSREGVTIIYQNKKLNVPASVIAPDPDASFDLFAFNPEDSLQALLAIGRNESDLKNIKEQLLAFIFTANSPASFYLDEPRLLSLLKENFSQFESQAKDAEIIFKNNELTIAPESYGKIFDYDGLLAQIKNRLAWLDSRPVRLTLQTDYPAIYAEQIDAALLEQAKTILRLAPIKLTASSTDPLAKDKEWVVNKERLTALITAKKSTGANQLFIGLKPEAWEEYVQAELAPGVNIEPVDAKFQITNGRVTEFKSSRNGQTINIDGTLTQLENALAAATTTPVTAGLLITEVASAVTNDNVNDLGINELLGTGESNFAGSPPNRRHNIAVGAAAVNGTLIKPAEEFSLLKTLGTIDGSTGYLPELVIKGDQTVPEYGGGLCQIGTTVFRAALASGLPITERRNHSYRVAYYEPAGIDATIYNPAPDFKFFNDTGYYILIQSRIEGNNLYFDFWGTKDGRLIEQTKPKIYNITPPPPGKIIDTDKLPPGEKKCTERAHSGADTTFTYTVTYPSGKINEQIFTSHYRPWQEVCLVGAAASSTPAVLDAPPPPGIEN